MNTVTDYRFKFIGGSDIPAIMGISKFKSRWELLREKAELVKDEFQGNEYTEYGNKMEPVIRDYINQTNLPREFVPHCKTEYDPRLNLGIRVNVDGYDGEKILEIKTTSREEGYEDYLVQLLFYMEVFGFENGLLAIYKRPKDFSEEFDPSRLEIQDVKMSEYKELTEKINQSVKKFDEDYAKLKANTALTEIDFLPNEVQELGEKILELEHRLEEYKQIETEYNNIKAALKKAMEANQIKKWVSPAGHQVTLVPDGEAKTVDELDVKTLQAENPELCELYTKTVEKKGRAGYIRITYKK